METYRIVRYYQRDDVPSETVETGLSRKEAQKWCSSREASSRTAKSEEAIERTIKYGSWFDGFTEE